MNSDFITEENKTNIADSYDVIIVGTGVAGLFEINYDSSQDYDEDYMNTNPNT